MHRPLVSVLIPVYRGRATIVRCIASLAAQTMTDWEAVIAIDDGDDGYPALIRDAGLAMERVRFVSTGGVRTGVAHARNIALDAARGALVAPLDADDTFAPERLAMLAPLAQHHGASADNVEVVEDATGAPIRTLLPVGDGVEMMDVERFLATNVPLMTIVDRRLQPRWIEVPICDDVTFNLTLFRHLDRLPLTRTPYHAYRQRPESECNAPDAALKADQGYRAVLAMMAAGSLSFGSRIDPLVRRSFEAKIALNRAYALAVDKAPGLTFQEFASGRGRV